MQILIIQVYIVESESGAVCTIVDSDSLIATHTHTMHAPFVHYEGLYVPPVLVVIVMYIYHEYAGMKFGELNHITLQV